MDLTQGVNMGVGSEGVSSSIFKSSCFSMPPQTEIQLLSRFFCYSKLLCSFGFWIEESFVTGFNESESWRCSLTCFREVHPKWAWVIITVFVCSEFCFQVRRNYFMQERLGTIHYLCLGWAGKIHQKTQQNVLALSRKTKKGMTPLNVLLKTG